MNRLTKKVKVEEWTYELEYSSLNGTHLCLGDLAFVNKLGKLEDTEEQLGCPIEVVFKALRDGIVYSESVCPCHLEKGITDDNYYFVIGYKYPSWYCLKDYKKTWWLREDKSE